MLTLILVKITALKYEQPPIWHANCLIDSCTGSISNNTVLEIEGGNMKKYVGVWLDHRQAFVVSLTKDQTFAEGHQEMIERIESDIERRVRLSGGSRTRGTPYGPQEISVDSKQEDRFKLQIRQYFKEILLRMSDADRILIFGPGEAKIELKKEIEKSKEIANRIKKIEPADKMTEKQIAAKIRAFFKPYL